MARYARLNAPGVQADGCHEQESDLFEVGEVAMTFIDKIAEGDGDGVVPHSSEAERAEQRKSIRDHIYTVPSTELLKFSKGLTDTCRGQVRQHKQDQQQNIENGNPNLSSRDPATQPAVVAICSHNSTASPASLQEQQGGVRGGASQSGRWVQRTSEDRSSRWRFTGVDSSRSENAANVVDNDSNSNSSVTSARERGCQWTPSTQRGTLHRDSAGDHRSHQEQLSSRVGVQAHYPQSQEKLSGGLYTSCNDSHYCQRPSKESSPVVGLCSVPTSGMEKTTLTSGMQSGPDTSYNAGNERNAFFPRSNSARDPPGLHRSSSTRDTPGQRSEMSIENWRDHPASRSAHVPSKHRVSFSLTETHELETHKQRERWKEPIAHGKKILGAKLYHNQQQQPLRYNYEQPGFVEKENICGGKAYTIYGVKEVKECPKVSSARHHPGFVRAFSLRENGSSYTKMPRAYSVNSGGRHMTMECDTCGKGGIGIVFLGLPGDDSNFCKSCKCSSGSEYKPQKKKKTIMHYCRKLLRFPQKSS